MRKLGRVVCWALLLLIVMAIAGCGSGDATATSGTKPERAFEHSDAPPGDMQSEPGEVVEALPNAMFKVKLNKNDHEVVGFVSHELRRRHTRIIPGDRVMIEVSSYDLDRGRITARTK